MSKEENEEIWTKTHRAISVQTLHRGKVDGFTRQP